VLFTIEKKGPSRCRERVQKKKIKLEHRTLTSFTRKEKKIPGLRKSTAPFRQITRKGTTEKVGMPFSLGGGGGENLFSRGLNRFWKENGRKRKSVLKEEKLRGFHQKKKSDLAQNGWMKGGPPKGLTLGGGRLKKNLLGGEKIPLFSWRDVESFSTFGKELSNRPVQEGGF